MKYKNVQLLHECRLMLTNVILPICSIIATFAWINRQNKKADGMVDDFMKWNMDHIR